MDRFELLYRGSLKSCNYRCSYCPFSKHRISEKELLKDREQWVHFVQTTEQYAAAHRIRTLMVAPYGEALIHPWYWEGLGRLSTVAELEAVGAQTNLSFPFQESMELFQKAGGNCDKLYLWATFHPEMVSVRSFAAMCRQLLQEGIHLCAGAVGVPQNIEVLQKLRDSLPEELYLWINSMDGLGRAYTKQETEAFLKIDPYFFTELSTIPADFTQCRGRLFVEADKGVRLCNISRCTGMGQEEFWNIQQQMTSSETPADLPLLSCGRKHCSCYLAYGGRKNFMNDILFGPYPIFRIPRRARAVFLDIDGTLLPKRSSGQERVDSWIRAGLEGLCRDKIPLFFATSLPYQEVRKRCREVWHLFSGGIFAAGAHMVVWDIQRGSEEKWEDVLELKEACLSVLKEIEKNIRCRLLSYRTEGKLYKITMLRPDSMQWKEEEREATAKTLQRAGICKVRVFTEDNCLQIVSNRATKAEGVRRICRRLHISPEETAAAGDSAEDVEMLKISGQQSIAFEVNNTQIACSIRKN